MKTRTLPIAALILSAATVAAPASAQGFPTKVVRLVVPFPAGGSNDVVARAMSQPLSKAFGQGVVVENRPGANTIIGTEAVARAPADGHTVLIVGFTFLSNAVLRSRLPFDPMKDFVAVTRLGTQPFVLTVHPSVPAKSIKELVAVARARPGELAYAANGYGTAQHLAGELLKVHEKIDRDFDLTGAMGIFAPAATPKEAIERLNAEVMRVVQLPEVKNGMLRDGFVVSPLGPAEYGAFTKVKMQQIERIARAAKIRLD